MKKVLFIDRDNTIIKEPVENFRVNNLEKLEFMPGAIFNLRKIATKLDYELVMVTNQDGLGTELFPEETFWPAHNKMLKILQGEKVIFAEILIDRSFAEDHKPTRKLGTAMLKKYIDNPNYDLKNSYVIGDSNTDLELAQNLGCKSIFVGNYAHSMAELSTLNWDKIYTFLKSKD